MKNHAFKSKNLFKNIKYCYQRITRGYCDADLWDMDGWFLITVPNMLKAFAKNHMGHPSAFEMEWFENNQEKIGMTYADYVISDNWNDTNERLFSECDKAWEDELIQIAENFDKANYYFNEKLCEKDSFQKAQGFKDKAFADFSKWFFYLWD